MVTREQRALEIRDGSGNVRPGVVNVLLFDQGARNMRALKTLGLFWGLAAVSVFIIILHWVLVPAFLIAGPVMATRKRKVTSEIENLSGVCPACREEIAPKMEADDALPKSTYCPKCNVPLQLVPTPISAG